ncbi:MAG: hypothetical protein AAGL98_00665 [Planctomycetota bacterium]
MNYSRMILFFTLSAASLTGCRHTPPAVGHPDAHTLELVVFDAIDDTDRETMVQAGRELGPVLQELPGYVSRTLAITDDGRWADIVNWSNLPDAEEAAHRVEHDPTLTPRTMPFFSLINMDPEQGFDFSHSKLIARHVADDPAPPDVVELVMFRRSSKVSAEAFTDQAIAAMPALAKLPGFLSTQLSVDPDGRYVHVVAWASHEQALAAPAVAMRVPELANWFGSIDEASIEMHHLKVIE